MKQKPTKRLLQITAQIEKNEKRIAAIELQQKELTAKYHALRPGKQTEARRPKTNAA